MSAVLADVFAFLLEHAPIVELIREAIAGGVSKDSLVAAIKSEMVKASDAEMRRELGMPGAP